MQRFSISLDDDLAGWVESQAERRGVSKAKIIRDAVATVKESDTELVQTGDVVARLAELERRVDALEGAHPEASSDTPGESAPDQEPSDASEEGPPKRDPSQTSPGSVESAGHDRLFEDVREYLADHPPHSADAEAAILTAWQRLRTLETARTADLREYVYERHGEGYASEQSLWQAIQRYLDELPGVQKGGYGEWEYAGDDAARDEMSG